MGEFDLLGAVGCGAVGKRIRASCLLGVFSDEGMRGGWLSPDWRLEVPFKSVINSLRLEITSIELFWLGLWNDIAHHHYRLREDWRLALDAQR